MDSKTNAPSFTVSLRGYDRMEVDEYLDSLAEALGQVEEAEDRCRGLQAHVDRLNSRIADLEERIGSEAPRSGVVLGERIAILLRSAEETASDTVNRAEVQAAEMLERAREEVGQAEDQARGALLRAEEQARRIEAAARAQATEIMAEAEARAGARTRQIEQWAEQVVSHTRAEEARMLTEQQEKREEARVELRALAEQRDSVAANMTDIRNALGVALGLVGPPVELPADAPAEAPDPEPLAEADEPVVDARLAVIDAPAAAPEAHTDTETAGAEVTGYRTGEMAALEEPAAVVEDLADADDGEEEMPWPAAFRPVDAVGDDGGSDGFETKLEAWVAGSPEPQSPHHFRRL